MKCWQHLQDKCTLQYFYHQTVQIFPPQTQGINFILKNNAILFFLTDAEEAYELTTLENDDLQDRQ